MKYTEMAGPVGVRARFRALRQHYDSDNWYSADDLARIWDVDKIMAAQSAAYMTKKGWLCKRLDKDLDGRSVPKFQPLVKVEEKSTRKSTPLRVERFNKYGEWLLKDIKDSSLSVGNFTNSQLLEMPSVRRYSYNYKATIISAVLNEATSRGLLIKEVYGYRLPKSGE